jgi:hypothetical protein
MQKEEGRIAWQTGSLAIRHEGGRHDAAPTIRHEIITNIGFAVTEARDDCHRPLQHHNILRTSHCTMNYEL